MKCVVEIDSGVMIPSFINIGSGIQEVMAGVVYRHTDSMVMS
jgi:hypothetical protein